MAEDEGTIGVHLAAHALEQLGAAQAEAQTAFPVAELDLIATEGEMKKVNWSSKRELNRSTWAVIAFTVGLALFCFAFDKIFFVFFYWTGGTGSLSRLCSSDDVVLLAQYSIHRRAFVT